MRRVGYCTGLEFDVDRLSWDGTTSRPLAWSAWYPVSPKSEHGPPPSEQFFDLGEIELDAPLADEPMFPLVLLSHGTGGSPESLGWLARLLAQQGFIVLGAHHHGNTGREPYCAEGFLCWWERALDMTALLTKLSTDSLFSRRLNLERVHMIGFSLGGYTALALAGAQTSVELYMQWVTQSGFSTAGPREFPNISDHVTRLKEKSVVFRSSWERQGNVFTDSRISSIIAIAPPPPVRGFTTSSLKPIEIPVTLITGEADLEAPSKECADWLAKKNSEFEHISVGKNVGHYTFLGLAASAVGDDLKYIFLDNPNVNRNEVHAVVGKMVIDRL